MKEEGEDGRTRSNGIAVRKKGFSFIHSMPF